MKRKIFTITLFCFLLGNYCSAQSPYPDYGNLFLGDDKFETFNRKMFKLNSGLNKYAIKPLNTIWASIMPQYGINRIASVADNIEYPKRLISNLIQKDFKSCGTETLRFITNTTIGLGGMFDPARHFFELQPCDEDLDQAFAKHGMKTGPYCVLPIIASTSPRGILGKTIDTALNPSSYIATPVIAFIKLGLLLNRTSLTQNLINTIENNYLDSYDVTKKLYGIEREIKTKNLDRKENLETNIELVNTEENNITNEIPDNTVEAALSIPIETSKEFKPDIIIENYNPQNAITDAMRTALFQNKEMNASMWNELSLWNRCFCKRIKKLSVNLDKDKDNYIFKYLIQKDKNAPLAIILPSIGEGVNSNHSKCFAKIFYDEGYSILIMGSQFQWEFIKSAPDNFRPGIPQNDIDYVRTALTKAITKLEDKYNTDFKENIVLGTSLGGLTTLFLGEKESLNNTLDIKKFIAICPPIELYYAMEQIDNNNISTDNIDEFKNNISLTAAKILKLLKENKEYSYNEDYLPFSEDEAKIITSFIMRQKLSDTIFSIENGNTSKKTNIYDVVNKMNYRDYAEKYLVSEEYPATSIFKDIANLFYIKNYLANNNNYKIYHALNDYLTTPEQLANLKNITNDNCIIFDNGSHLGFLYREEFQKLLKEEITR